MIDFADQPGGPEKQTPQRDAPAPVPVPASKLDTSNQFLVVPLPNGVGIKWSNLITTYLATAKALNLAAWIVSLVDPELKVFPRLLAEIKKP